MCGVAGLISPRPAAPLPDPCLQHRGPDAAGRERLTAGFDAQLVHERLAIQDLSAAGAQPFTSADGRYVLVYNGEIYNYWDLRRECEAMGDVFRSDMDGEAILHLWARYGVSALARLNGIYALAVVDTDAGDVVLARDPLGVKPLFVVRDGSNLWFASELSALQRMGAPVGGADSTGLAQFLTFLWVPQPNTPFSSVESLPPAGVLTWRAGRTFESNVVYSAPKKPAGLEVAGDLVQAAGQRQLLSDVPVGLMASGGVDSSLLWWAAAGGLAEAYTIEWGIEAGTEGLSEDAAAVRRLEQRFGTPTTYLAGEDAEQVVLPHSGDLFADPAYELARHISRQAQADGIKVLLCGQGGDELFGGYRRHAVARLLAQVRLGRGGRFAERALAAAAGSRVGVEYAARLARALAEPDPFRGYMQLCSYSTPEERAKALGCMAAEVSDDVVWAQHREVYDSQPDGSSFLRKVMTVDQQVYMPGLGLAYMDRAGMEFGVEIRVPWLDLDLVAWSRTLPDDVLVRRGRGKWITKELAARELGPELAHRPKRGFAAPARLVNRGSHSAGQRGHRQGNYFARARQVLDAHLEATS